MGTSNRYTERLPSHHCGDCTHIVFEDEERCPECDAARPSKGWRSIQEGVDPWLGRVFDGRYVVTRLVGQGAMGSVYRASSLAISRDFAIKVINFKEGAAGIDADQVRARLHREIEAIGRLRNPHVVPFYEVIELYDHFVGIVMDYIEGSTLEQLVHDSGPLPLRRAAEILRQVANGIHEAHEAGMIHRDVKPDNIMVERLPVGDDFAHVLDFGIVRLEDGVQMTKGFLGTPLYASPEQAMAGHVDRRSDIYSLGAVFFFMLTGRPPFVSSNVYDILQSHVRKPAPRLAEARTGHAFPESLEVLVADLLAKSPERRPQNLAEVIARIDDMRRSGVFEEPHAEPDSVEFELFDAPGRYTRSGSSYKTDPDGLGEESSSVFESEERDDTGPKAVIFKRGPSRGTVRRMIDEQRQANATQFDRILEGNTGAHALGLTLSQRVVLATCSATGEIGLTDTAGNVFRVRNDALDQLAHMDGVASLAVSSSSALVGTTRGVVWSVASNEGPGPLMEALRGNPIRALAMDASDRVWVAGTESGRVYKCTPAAGERVWLRVQDGPPVSALAVSPAGDTFAVARRHGEVEVCSVATPQKAYARFAIGGTARSLAFSDDGHLIAAVLDNETICVHHVEGGHRIHTLLDRRNRILALCFRGHDLLGYFQRDDKLFVRQLDREIPDAE